MWGIIENDIETTIGLYGIICVDIGVMFGIMENKLETAI